MYYPVLITEVPGTAPAVVKRNWGFVLDFSGSMGWALEKVLEFAMAQVRRVPIGDSVTVSWFSSEGGCFGHLVKGVIIHDESDFDHIEAVIRKNLYTRGCTCFSEVLASYKQIISDMSVHSSIFNLYFLTDGCPVVNNTQREVAAVEAALAELADRLGVAVFVGFGDYYRRNLMTQMALWSGAGMLVHSDDLPSVDKTLMQYLDLGTGASSKEQIDGLVDKRIYFLMTPTGEVALVESKRGKAIVSPGCKVYQLADKVNGKVAVGPEWYAGAYTLSKLGFRDEALAMMSAIGDVFMCNVIDGGWTLADTANAESALLSAVRNEDDRFVAGRQKGYRPAPDALCVLDVLDGLIDDPEAMFYPYSSVGFEYKRSGRKSITDPNAPKFEYSYSGCKFSTLTWSSDRLNLSVLAKINGTIDLGDDCIQFGLPKQFATHVWRNYTIVEDGSLKTTAIPVSASEDTMDWLDRAGLLSRESADTVGKIWLLHLDRIPVMNRAIMRDFDKAGPLAELVAKNITLKARVKVLKYYFDKVKPEAAAVAGYTPEQAGYLANYFIGKNGEFDPPSKKADAEDFRWAPTFEYIPKRPGAKGGMVDISKLPKVDDCLKFLAGGAGNGYGPQVAVVNALRECPGPFTTDDADWLADDIAELNTIIRRNEARLARARFAVLLGHGWFTDLGDRQHVVCKVPRSDIEVHFVEESGPDKGKKVYF